MNVRHYNDARITYIAEEPYYKGIIKLKDKQIKKILWGSWRGLCDEKIINKLKKSEMINIKRIKYHLGNKDILNDKRNYRSILLLKLAVVEEMISELRAKKSKLRNDLKNCKDEGGKYE